MGEFTLKDGRKAALVHNQDELARVTGILCDAENGARTTTHVFLTDLYQAIPDDGQDRTVTT